MEKIILTWNADKQQYSSRVATMDERIVLVEIDSLMKSIKSFYYDVIKYAAEAHMSIDLFIDNECYYAWLISKEKAERVDELANTLGIQMDVWRHVHWF